MIVSCYNAAVHETVSCYPAAVEAKTMSCYLAAVLEHGSERPSLGIREKSAATRSAEDNARPPLGIRGKSARKRERRNLEETEAEAKQRRSKGK